ncbi:DVU0298 family protein [Desulforudis sp. 1088]|uniref:DVU0298 family protein n=1 Tax=unclassified Candidatus Desulforudis TaxID=2635950 RepID=UPI003CE4BC62
MASRAEMIDLIDNSGIDAVVNLARAQPATVRYLISLLYEREGDRRWRAVAALGRIAAERASGDPEAVREIIRRLFWMLNHESGNMAWSVPEAVGDIIARCPDLYGDFAANLVYNHLDDEPLRRGVLWAIGRVGEQHPELVAYAIPEVEPLLEDPDPEIRGYAAWALGKLKVAGPSLAGLLPDASKVEIWEDGELRSFTISQLAERALAHSVLGHKP